MNREQKIEIIRSFLNMSGMGLELGPHVNPMFRKSKGDPVRYLESRTTDELRALMVSQNRDPSIVEDIDYILQRGTALREMVNSTKFDWVVSSHVIEHIPDFVSHLNEVASVLRGGGVYALLVPDRNYCFDCLKPATTLGAVIEAHLMKRQCGSVASMVDEWRYAVRPEGVTVGGWGSEATGRRLVQKYSNWLAQVRRAIKNGGSEATNWFGHQWHFDPVNFSDIVADLIDLDLIQMEIIFLKPTYHMDFIALFRKTGNPNAENVRVVGGAVKSAYRKPNYAETF